MEIELFRTGTHITMAGDKMEFSAKVLGNCATSYDPAVYEAPVVIGHPQNDDPAFGWVKRLRFDGQRLHADLGELHSSFSEAVRDGRYRKVSPSFYTPKSPDNPRPGTLYLRHVGFLGAQAPSVKDLKPVRFSECGDGYVTFAESERETDLMEREQQLRRQQIRSFLDKLVIEARFPSGRVEGMAAFMESISGEDGTISFSESGGQVVNVGALEWLKQHLQSMPPMVAFGEHPAARAGGPLGSDLLAVPEGYEADPERLVLARRAAIYARQHSVSFAEAVRTLAEEETAR